ncbi:MAG: hypothetical protein R3C14_20865 [Caldilineaceae bacterium]
MAEQMVDNAPGRALPVESSVGTSQLSGPVSASQPLWQQRGDGVTLIAGYHFVVAGLFLLGTLILIIPTGILGVVAALDNADAMVPMVVVGFVALIVLALSMLNLAVGYGLWTLKAWGRAAAIALAFISLFGFPIGTVIGALTLWYLFKPEVAARFE